MNKSFKFLLQRCFAIALCGAMTQAGAAGSNASLTVSASVPASCSVSSSALQFGTYTAAAVQQSAEIGVVCSSGTSYTVALDAGTAGSTAARKLTGAGGSLNYALYKDAGQTSVWGNASGVDTVSRVGDGSQQKLPVYGVIPAGQSAGAGSYNDVVAVTLTY